MTVEVLKRSLTCWKSVQEDMRSVEFPMKQDLRLSFLQYKVTPSEVYFSFSHLDSMFAFGR